MRNSVVLFMFFAAVLMVLTSNFRPEQDSPMYQAFYMSLSLLVAAVYFIEKSRLQRNFWLSISFLFFLSYAIIYFNIPIVRLFGIEVVPQVKEFIWADQSHINRSVEISSMGMVFFFLGSAVFHAEKKDKKRGALQVYYDATYLPLFPIVFLALFLISSGSYVVGEYTASDASALSSYFYKLFKVAITALIVLKVTNYLLAPNLVSDFRAYLRHLGPSLIVTLTVFVAISFRVGDRGPIIYLSLLTFGPYLARRAALGIISTGVLAYSAAFILSVLGAARQARFNGGTFSERLLGAMGDTNFFYYSSYRFEQPVPMGHTLELAASIRTLNHAIAEVPANYDHTYGAFMAQQVASVFPGLGDFINDIFYAGEVRMDGSSNFITYLIQGANPTYGDGTSIVAELYLDFGALGVALGLFAFGALVGRNEGKIVTGNRDLSFVWVAVLMYFGNALYLARSSLFLELSNVVLVFILLKLFAKKRSRRPSGDTGRVVPSSTQT